MMQTGRHVPGPLHRIWNHGKGKKNQKAEISAWQCTEGESEGQRRRAGGSGGNDGAGGDGPAEVVFWPRSRRRGPGLQGW